MILTLEQVIGAGMCDPNGRLSILGALTLMEDFVTATMDKMEINGFKMRREYNAVVVFSKNHVQFLKPICWNDKVTVSCFVSTKSMARLCVDVCVKNTQGEIAMYGRTEVCAVDVESGRIRRLDAVGIGDKVVAVPALSPMEWEPFEVAGELVENVTVRTSNIDYAGHTNNVEYIRLLLNTFSLDEWRGGIVPRELQVAYVSQSFLGDNLAIYRENRSDNERLFIIKKGEQDVLRCVLRW